MDELDKKIKDYKDNLYKKYEKDLTTFLKALDKVFKTYYLLDPDYIGKNNEYIDKLKINYCLKERLYAFNNSLLDVETPIIKKATNNFKNPYLTEEERNTTYKNIYLTALTKAINEVEEYEKETEELLNKNAKALNDQINDIIAKDLEDIYNPKDPNNNEVN